MTQAQAQHEPSLEQLVDEFAALHEQLAPLQDKYDTLKKTLSAFVSANKSNQTLSLLGNNYILDYSAPTNEAKCTIPAEEFIRRTLQWDALSVSAAKARPALSAEVFSQVFETVPGSRRFRRVRHRW
jgi:hypothetical protein